MPVVAAAPDAGTLAAELRAAWHRSDEIFALLPAEAWLHRPIGLRHPFLFYLGHLPAFAWNQLARGALEAEHLDAAFDQLFERGIDPDGDAAARDQSISTWPSVVETLAYRDAVRGAMAPRIAEVFANPIGVLREHGRVLHLVIEHELMHHETLLYMFAECPDGMIARPSTIAGPEGGEGRAAAARHIPAGPAVLGAAWTELPFGWDNEFGKTVVELPAFELDSLPVRNRDWLAFLHESGDPEALVPQAWVRRATGWAVKTVFGPVPFEQADGWPVQVSCDQATRYCQWRGGRLPTEAELQRVAYEGGAQRYPWGAAEPTAAHGNFGFRRWSPAPVGHAPASAGSLGVEELVGNGWEWTSTTFAPLPGFRAWAPTYAGYSADFFDGAHNVVFGASWATDPRLVRPSFRNWYRRSYPYPFTSFRVARSV